MAQIKTEAALNGYEMSFDSIQFDGNSNSPKDASVEGSIDCDQEEESQCELAFEFLRGEKINSMLLSTTSDHHLFTSHGKCWFGARYRCRDRNCRAFVVYDEKTNKCFRLSLTPPHKHEKCDSDIEVDYWNLVALNEMRDRCSKLETLDKVRKIFTMVKQM